MLRDFSKDEFDVIIQAGQSNSEGYGLGNASRPFIPNKNILYLNKDSIICMAHEDVNGNEIIGNFSLSFCSEYVKSKRLLHGRKLLVIRAAVGGTGFLDNRWKETDDLYFEMIEMTKTALNLNPKNKLIALLWHQGETDALLNASKQVHFNNLATLVRAVRKTFNHQDLPFICADFVYQWKKDNVEICEPIITAIKEVCTNVGNARFVETDELQSNDERVKNEDTIHFCREALNQLGVKYYEAFYDIINS